VVTLGRKQGLEIAGGHFSHFATIAALSADPRESVLESDREDRGLSGARKAILPRRRRREEARGIERWSTRIFGEYAFLEDSRYANQTENAGGENSDIVQRANGSETAA